MDRVKLTKERIEELWIARRMDLDPNYKFEWFATTILDLKFDDKITANVIGEYLYNMCLDIHNHDVDRFSISRSSSAERYLMDTCYKNLLFKCGMITDYNVFDDCIPFWLSTFDYDRHDMIINNRETMDWLLNDLMGENDDE